LTSTRRFLRPPRRHSGLDERCILGCEGPCHAGDTLAGDSAGQLGALHRALLTPSATKSMIRQSLPDSRRRYCSTLLPPFEFIVTSTMLLVPRAAPSGSETNFEVAPEFCTEG
jgi:hypothetical protein